MIVLKDVVFQVKNQSDRLAQGGWSSSVNPIFPCGWVKLFHGNHAHNSIYGVFVNGFNIGHS
jgi:hypothetical protein